jgi:hypothetical protein
MCCFSRPVLSVSATNIFARAGEGGRQFLVYSMTLNAKEELAMVLPLPVKAGTDEKGVDFIDLSEYPDFFSDLRKAFPTMLTRGLSDKITNSVAPASKLEVIKVGSFEASFVPTVKDFSRLDERFRLPAGTWDKLPDYADFGFAVFKLKSGNSKIHPMAFSFPRREPKQLFFPTVHIHDGKVHDKADFDHALFVQPHDHEPLQTRDWEESHGNAGSFVKVAKTKGIVDSAAHCYRKEMRGQLPNRDTFLSIAA